jgi:S1-C subfamily serine protease
VVTLGLSAVGRFTLAIPIELFLRERQELESFEPRRSARAWLGLYPQTFDGGVMVTGLVPGGPAQKAGLARGDMLLSVDGEKIGSLRELYSAIWKKAPGELVGLMVLREGSLRSFSIRAADRYAFYE